MKRKPGCEIARVLAVVALLSFGDGQVRVNERDTGEMKPAATLKVGRGRTSGVRLVSA